MRSVSQKVKPTISTKKSEVSILILIFSRYVSLNVMKVHKKLHTGDTPIQCTLCELKFQTRGARKYHLRKDHRVDLYKCQLCPDVGFIRTSELRRHNKIHE